MNIKRQHAFKTMQIRNNNNQPTTRVGLYNNLGLTMKAIVILCSILFFSCDKETDAGPQPNNDQPNDVLSKEPRFANSIVSTDIDFITNDDPNTFSSLNYIGQEEKEMPDSRNDNLMDAKAFVYKANFTDGNTIKIWAHSSFETETAAKKYAEMVTGPLGKLPTVMRKELSHVIIHKGDAGAFAESEGHFFMLYSENMETRVSNHDLEETVFHESMHAALQLKYREDAAWLKAQKDDNAFITEYAEKLPDLEDFPESAIFAYTMIKHPGRLSSEIESWVKTYNSNRLAFFKTIFS